jgi:hypothetical protein
MNLDWNGGVKIFGLRTRFSVGSFPSTAKPRRGHVPTRRANTQNNKHVLIPASLRKWTFRGRKNRGIGILAHEQTNLIGWKPMPLLLAHAY